MSESQKQDQIENEIARRRWRNMMIAAYASGKVEPEQRKHLEQQRKALGISISEASGIAELYKREGGGIKLFGNQQQRIALFRDVLTMMLADGSIAERESKLIIRLADHLNISEEALHLHMEECKKALEENQENSASGISSGMSSRIYRSLASKSSRISIPVTAAAEYESAASENRHMMQLSLLEELIENQPPLPADIDIELIARFEAVCEEDQKVSEHLIKEGLIVEQQIKDRFEKQQEEFRERGRINSFLTGMVKDGIIEGEIIQKTRRTVRAEGGAGEPEGKTLSHENGEFSIRYFRDSLDQSFYLTVVQIQGQADHHTVPLMRKVFKEIRELPGGENKFVILDLSSAEYISSAAIGTIIELRADLLDRWGDVRFVNLSSEVEDVIRMLGVDSLITSYHDLDEAILSFASFSEVAES